MASFFESLFGGGDKPNIGAAFPNPPRQTLAEGSVDQLTDNLDQLLQTFQRRARGEDMFDVIKFIFEPQLNRLNEAFGIQAGGGDLGPFGRRQGALGRLEADLQRRGLLDSGVSGVLQAQLESQRALGEADLFGQAKALQREDIDQSLANIGNISPALFEAQNIPNRLKFENEFRQFQNDQAREQAHLGFTQNRNSQKAAGAQNALALAAAPFTGGMSLAALDFSKGGGSGNFSNFTGIDNTGNFFRPTPPPPGFQGLPLSVRT